MAAPTVLSRRSILVTALASGVHAARAAAPVRLGVVQYGTLQWMTGVIARHRFDEAHGITLQPARLADTGAGRIALLAGAADIIMSDWLFVAAQRSAGTPLLFAPLSTGSGGILVRPDSPIRGMSDLRGRKLGVAGGPFDKSWLIVQAAARHSAALDLAHAADVVYGAPPLLSAKLQQGELDAVLTFWNFAARLAASGCHQVISVADCLRSLGLPGNVPLVGFVFHQAWADKNARAASGFLDAVHDAERQLAEDPAEWTRIRKLMDAPDPAVFASLRQRFLDGLDHAGAAQTGQAIARVFTILLQTGGPRATAGLRDLPDGIVWHASGAA